MTEQRPLRILVVDEEEPLTHVLTIAFELEGWDVSVAHSGADAIQSTFDPDVVLLDLELPDQRGTDVVTALRAAGSTATVVFLTGRTDHEDRMAAYAAGGDDYVTKPFGIEGVVDHIQAISRRLGFAESSRTVDDLVLDVEAGMAWRGAELLRLTSLEFVMLRELVEQRGTRMSVGDLLRAAARRGIRVPLNLASGMLARMRKIVNGAGLPLLFADDAGWVVA